MKKSWILILSIVLAAALSIGSTVAYLQDADSDVNVMTLGKVDIVQVEEERSGDELVKFDNYNKTLFPGVYSEAKPVIADGYYAAQNAIDKIVSVDNVGKSDAYVRTIFAFEQGTMTVARFEEVMNINKNESGDWTWTKIGNGQTIGAKPGVYTVYVAVYNKILPKGESTSESLKQVLLVKEGTNEDVKALDANGNQMYEILVLSQAVQSMGFESMGAAEALNEAFGAVDQAHLNEWMGGMEAEVPGEQPDDQPQGEPVTPDELEALLETIEDGDVKEVYLESNTMLAGLDLPAGDLTIDLAGKNLTIGKSLSGWTLIPTANAESATDYIYVRKGAKLTIRGKGDIISHSDAVFFMAGGTLKLNVTGTVTSMDEEMGTLFWSEGKDESNITIQQGHYTAQGMTYGGDMTINITGGSFDFTREELNQEVALSKIWVENDLFESAIKFNITGGTFKEESSEGGESDETIVTTADELQTAVTSANNGETISVKLGANLTLNEQIKLTKGSLTIDLNGYDLSGPGSEGYFFNICAPSEKTFCVKGKGNISSTAIEMINIGSSADVTFDVDGTISATKGCLFFLSGADTTLTINNGVYSAVQSIFGSMDAENTSVNLNGGEFVATKGDIESQLGSFESTIADDVKFAEVGSEEIYVTLGSELMEVVASVNEGNTVKVKLGGNITLLQKITLSQGHLILSGEYDLATTEPVLFCMAGGDLTLDVTGKVIAYRDEEGMGNDTFEMASADSDVVINSGEYQNMHVTTGAAANLTINGGSFDITREKLEAQCAIEYPEWNVEATNLTINGGTFATN